MDNYKEKLRVQLHKMVDDFIDDREYPAIDESADTSDEPETKRELPKDKRVVRTKSTGDRVYCLDEVKKSRQWVTNPDILKKIGFELNDVVEVDDTELLKYQMGPALYRVDDAKA